MKLNLLRCKKLIGIGTSTEERFKEEEGLLTAAHHHVREAPELYVSVRVGLEVFTYLGFLFIYYK